MADGGRDEGIDLARGLAVVIMISTHAYDGWVADAARSSPGYQLTRTLGVLPLPTFLVLAGLGLALRRDMRSPGGADRALRGGVVGGARVLLAGYGVSLALALIDGGLDVRTLLRADVLHAIGLSSIAVACLVRALDGVRRAALVGLGLALLVLVSTPACTALGRGLDGPLRVLAAPFVEVPGYTKMPVIPLVAFVLFGAFALPAALRTDARLRLGIATFASVAAVAASRATSAWAEAVPGVFDRTHPAILGNGLDLAARATALVSAATFVTPRLPAPMRAELVRLGRHSLLAYAAHLPFAYGRLARPVHHRLSMAEASVGYVLLLVFVVFVVRQRARLARR